MTKRQLEKTGIVDGSLSVEYNGKQVLVDLNLDRYLINGKIADLNDLVFVVFTAGACHIKNELNKILK